MQIAGLIRSTLMIQISLCLRRINSKQRLNLRHVAVLNTFPQTFAQELLVKTAVFDLRESMPTTIQIQLTPLSKANCRYRDQRAPKFVPGVCTSGIFVSRVNNTAIFLIQIRPGSWHTDRNSHQCRLITGDEL